ncbi:MAG: hypothetical protein H7Y12_14160, partial [Sphingobacteriaceae bacterium]|nr:hypothetical protein [Cytophagaceae bacterium]
FAQTTFLNSEERGGLNTARLSFGVAQKVINLFFKYLWTSNEWFNEPFHCPYDGVVKSHLGKLKSDVQDWTKIKGREEYEQAMKCVRQAAENKNQSIAVWELGIWSDAIHKKNSGENEND